MVRFLNDSYRWYYNYIPEGVRAFTKVSVTILRVDPTRGAVTWRAAETVGDIEKGNVYTSTLGWLFTDTSNERSLREVIAETKIKPADLFQRFFLNLKNILCLL